MSSGFSHEAVHTPLSYEVKGAYARIGSDASERVRPIMDELVIAAAESARKKHFRPAEQINIDIPVIGQSAKRFFEVVPATSQVRTRMREEWDEIDRIILDSSTFHPQDYQALVVLYTKARRASTLVLKDNLLDPAKAVVWEIAHSGLGSSVRPATENPYRPLIPILSTRVRTIGLYRVGEAKAPTTHHLHVHVGIDVPARRGNGADWEETCIRASAEGALHLEVQGYFRRDSACRPNDTISQGSERVTKMDLYH